MPIGGRYEHLSRDVDHSNLAKFSSRSDHDYINLRGKILELVEEAPNVIRARICTGPGGKITHQYVVKTHHLPKLTIPRNDEVTRRPLWDIAFTLPFRMKDSKNPNFTGRGDMLDRLDIEVKSPSSKVIVLHGLGGTGKTQIALEYVHSYHEGYSAVFWVDGTSEETANLGFRSIAQRLIDYHVSISTTSKPDYARIAQILGLGSAVSQDGQLIYAGKGSTNQVLEAVKQWFSQKENQHWLLVLDNVDELTSFDIHDFIPMASHGKVLITSRRKECICLGKGLEVGQMLEPEGVLLLLKSAELDNPVSDTEQSPAHNNLLERLRANGSPYR